MKLTIPKIDLTGKFALITGGNEGIGFHTALQLAKMNCSVMLVSRNPIKSEDAVNQIRKLSGNLNIHYDVMDLGNFDSIRQFSTRFQENNQRLDYLINNAGCLFHEYNSTDDGLEATVHVNHLGPLLLTMNLMPLINQTDYSKVLFLSSFLHYKATLTLPNDLNLPREEYNGRQIYNKTKLMNVISTKYLQTQMSNPTTAVCSVDPGFVATNFTYASLPNSIYGYFYRIVMTIAHKIVGKTPDQGALTSVYTIVESDIQGGGYYSNCKLAEPNPICNDGSLSDELLNQSLKIIGYSKSNNSL